VREGHFESAQESTVFIPGKTNVEMLADIP